MHPTKVRGLRRGLLALLAGGALFALACSPKASTEGTVPDGAASGEGGEASDDLACTRYARRMCDALGPRTEACRSALGTVSVMSPRACAVGVEDWELTLERIAGLREACDTLVEQVCAAIGADSAACNAIREDLSSVPPGHCPALLSEAPRLIQRIQEREAETRPMDAATWAEVAKSDAPGFGAADARAVLVVFSDFQCPYCARAAETMEKIKESHGDRVRVVFRHYPLPFHHDAQGAAQAAMAAFQQGKFWEFHDLLFENQKSLDVVALEGYAKQLGLDMEKFKATSGAEATAEQVVADMRLAERVHVRGTPTLFINGKRVENALDYDAVKAEIDSALAASQ